MEPVTHFLYGACLSRAGFNRKTALATVTMTLAAEAADIDMLWYLRGSGVGFVHHRGFTHTVWGAPIVAAMVIAFVYAARRLWHTWRPPKDKPARAGVPSQPRWLVLYGLACIAAYSHLLLDFTNNYGVRFLWPLLNRWFAWDIVFIIEPVMYVFMIAGLVLPYLFHLVNQEIGAKSPALKGRGGAIAALVLIALLWGFRDYEHRRALAAMESVLYNGKVPVRVGAFPYQTNPFKWHGVVETETTYETVRVNSLGPDVDPQGNAQLYYKPVDNDVLRAARATYLGGAYMDWSRFPLLDSEQRDAPPGYVVRFRDLRFMYPEIRTVALGAYVVLDPQLKVVWEGFASRNALTDRLERTTPEDLRKP